jgi:prepilin-type processing-associated H-X9-DG protein
VPLVPKLAEIVPGATLPVPIAPIMLSPPPALTTTSADNPYCAANSGRSVPAAVSDGLSRTLMGTEASDREHVGNDETRRAGDSCWACGSNCFPLNARVINVSEVDGFQSKHFDGIYGLFADGHVTFITNRTDAKVLIAISTKSGGETESLSQ